MDWISILDQTRLYFSVNLFEIAPRKSIDLEIGKPSTPVVVHLALLTCTLNLGDVQWFLLHELSATQIYGVGWHMQVKVMETVIQPILEVLDWRRLRWSLEIFP